MAKGEGSMLDERLFLTGSAALAIFCPRCNGVLDAATSVAFTVVAPSGYRSSKVVHAAEFDAIRYELESAGYGVVDVVDGRVVFNEKEA